MRILRGAFLASIGAAEVNAAHLAAGEREVRQDVEQALQTGDIAVLDRVRESRVYRGDPRLSLANAVLAYEGESRRYWAPHPLLETTPPVAAEH